MLVFARHEGQSVCIGDNIVLTVTRIEGHKIRLGIETTERLPILRGELKTPPASSPERPPASLKTFELVETL